MVVFGSGVVFVVLVVAFVIMHFLANVIFDFTVVLVLVGFTKCSFDFTVVLVVVGICKLSSPSASRCFVVVMGSGVVFIVLVVVSVIP